MQVQHLGFFDGSDGKESACNEGNQGLISESGRSPKEGNGYPLQQTSLVAQTVKCLPTMWETLVRSLGWEDLVEKEMETHFSTLAWKIPWTEELDSPQYTGSQRVRQD